MLNQLVIMPINANGISFSFSLQLNIARKYKAFLYNLISFNSFVWSLEVFGETNAMMILLILIKWFNKPTLSTRMTVNRPPWSMGYVQILPSGYAQIELKILCFFFLCVQVSNALRNTKRRIHNPKQCHADFSVNFILSCLKTLWNTWVF